MRRQRNTCELKEQEKWQKKKKLNELEISNLLYKEVKVIVIKMFIKLRRKMITML